MDHHHYKKQNIYYDLLTLHPWDHKHQNTKIKKISFFVEDLEKITFCLPIDNNHTSLMAYILAKKCVIYLLRLVSFSY